MEIIDICINILKLQKTQTKVHQYGIKDLEFNGVSSHFLTDKPNCFYLQFANYDEKIVAEIKKSATNSEQTFATFTIRGKYIVFTWEPYVPTFTVYVFESESDLKHFLLAHITKLFQV